MKTVVSVDVMRNSDAFTIENSTSGRELMARAGKAVFDNVDWKEPVAIVCGSGNNAGDGYVTADLLHKNGADCRIFLVCEKFSADGKYYYDICVKDGVPTEKCSETTDFSGYGTVVDCIFGTGFSGAPREREGNIIEKINSSGAYVISVDINSGLNGDSGMGTCCVKSDMTISIGSYKSGHFLNMAKDVIKEKINCDIGIETKGERYKLFEAEDCKTCLPERKNFSNKGTYGYVALIGGSTEYSGAVKLANLACSAMVSGAGVVKLACPRSIINGVSPYILESTLFPLSDEDGKLKFSEEELKNLIGNVKTVAIGMGIGKSEEIKKILMYLLSNFDGKLIIDADGLNCLAEMDDGILKNSRPQVILTPHLREFSRLSGLSAEEILDNPINSAKNYAKTHGLILLLKGPTTVVTDGNEIFLVDRGCPGMATAGSGDVLSGILSAVCAYNDDLLKATAAAAYINGFSGELAQRETNPVSMLSGDTVRHIGAAITKILSGDNF